MASVIYDMRLTQNREGLIDVDFEDETEKEDESLYNAIVISILGEKRDEEVGGVLNRGGWHGEEVHDYGYTLWAAYYQARKTPGGIALIKVRARGALQWMIDEGIVSEITSLDAEFIDDGVAFSVVLRSSSNELNRFYIPWTKTYGIQISRPN
jgi:phage gp46-like protein